MRPDDFWPMTLAEFRAAVDGHVRVGRESMRRLAWQVMHQLVAAGCDADKVTVAALLGEKTRRPTLKQRIARDPEVQKAKQVERMMARLRRERKEE